MTTFDMKSLLRDRRAKAAQKELNKLKALAEKPCPPGCEAFDDEPRLRPDKHALIDQANDIIAEYEFAGFVLTLRQLFYQFVARDLLANKQAEYKRLCAAIGDGRNQGLIPWDQIEDRTRFVREQQTWGSPGHCAAAAAQRYQEDLWASQSWRPEVWIEKDALVGVIEGVCDDYRVPYLSCRGYGSETLLYDAAKQFRKHLLAGNTPIVLYLGDHDPSGLQMSDNIEYKLRKFTRGQKIEVRRLALNEDQTDDLPPNLVKDSDTRSADYKRDYGDECWELDALDPKVIANLIKAELDEMIDSDAWAYAKSKEDQGKDQLRGFAEYLEEGKS